MSKKQLGLKIFLKNIPLKSNTSNTQLCLKHGTQLLKRSAPPVSLLLPQTLPLLRPLSYRPEKYNLSHNANFISYSQKIDHKPKNYLCTSYFIL